ncbi:trans-sulfuration enzyme family protein [Priestia koreensis]|uniref:trans-sulfuration enzyme family protein n=1 Tax=Priestia koreensis TaxID=284581 RepID=UPI001F58936D|nr:PLP-dependent aspartate aminotransferase family protein [Priestia koreensis]UNL86042.1 PLP-dependent transferase [Priestia koreensis]
MSLQKQPSTIEFGTKLIHAKTGIGEHYGAVSVPIYQVSTFNQEASDNDGKYDYSRSGNPTREALENTIAQLENGYAGFAFSSGMAAISSVLCLFKSGDEIVVSDDTYGGTYRVLTQLFNRFGIKAVFADTTSIAAVKEAITPQTKAIYLETPSNPFLSVTDIKEVAAVAAEQELLTIVDNTFLTPYLQQPLELGADIVVHSATKYISGHSDVVGGLVVTATEPLANEIKFIQNAFGAILGPQDCWLLLRGLKTLKVRLEQQQKTAQQLAQWLQEHEQVEETFYPGLTSHPDYELSKQQTNGAGGIISFKLKTPEHAKQFLQGVQFASVGVSLGGVETILTQPATMSHASIPEAKRLERGITEALIRISVGLEEFTDLKQDFEQALEKHPQTAK